MCEQDLIDNIVEKNRKTDEEEGNDQEEEYDEAESLLKFTHHETNHYFAMLQRYFVEQGAE